MPDQCPSCETAIPPDAVLCVDCGFDLRSGKHLVADIEAASNAEIQATEPSDSERDDHDSAFAKRVRRGKIYVLIIIAILLGGQLIIPVAILITLLMSSPSETFFGSISLTDWMLPAIIVGLQCFFLYRGGYFARFLAIIQFWTSAVIVGIMATSFPFGLGTIFAILICIGCAVCGLTLMYSPNLSEFLWSQKEKTRQRLMY